jgi:uncharacterized protein YoxC
MVSAGKRYVEREELEVMEKALDRLSGRVDHLTERMDVLSGRVDHLTDRVEVVVHDIHQLTLAVAELSESLDARSRRWIGASRRSIGASTLSRRP